MSDCPIGWKTGKTHPPKEGDFVPWRMEMLHNAHDKRIAELEAELTNARGFKVGIEGSLREWKARAEKVEAEVERLKAQRDHWWELVERAKLLLPGWPPEGGGGRESGESGLAPGVEVANHGNAAANPAAPSLSARKATRKTEATK